MAQAFREFHQHLILQEFVEIDHDIAAKNHLESSAYRPIAMQVELAELNQAARLLSDSDLVLTAGLSRPQLAQRGGYRGEVALASALVV